MEAERKPRSITSRGKEIAQGPLVVPSYSSKALPRISVVETIAATAPSIVSPVLISAYDIGYHGVSPSDFDVPLVMIDSGGYETLIDEDGKKRGGNADQAAFEWSAELYKQTLASLGANRPVITVSYDNTHLAIGEQLAVATDARDPRFGSSFLLKPQEPDALTIEAIAPHAAKLGVFDVIGVTEKEAGSSFLDRLVFIGRLRDLLDAHDVDKPIHVFGGLDPFMTPLYLLAGADIVDGLSWLRYAFADGSARYLAAESAIRAPAAPLHQTEWDIRRANYLRSVDMQIAFGRFQRTRDYGAFSADPAIVRKVQDVHQAWLSIRARR
jgi:hypothetical protein